jgi:hypothetical protein
VQLLLDQSPKRILESFASQLRSTFDQPPTAESVWVMLLRRLPMETFATAGLASFIIFWPITLTIRWIERRMMRLRK